MYSPAVLDHFEHPRCAGELPDADVGVTQENPACGDILKLCVRLSDRRINEVRFKAKGCVTAIACSSWLAEQMQNRSLDELKSLRREDIVQALGGLTPETMHGSHLAFDALQTMLRRAQSK